MLPKYNAFQLKLFMAFLMVFDHIDHIPGLLPAEMAAIFHVLTRCVSVFFAFLAVDGFHYTHSRVRYVLRLFVWAAIMAAGNAIFNLLAPSPELQVHNNIFLTLALGVLMLCVLAGTDPKAQGRPSRLPLRICGVVLLLLIASIFAEGGIVLLPFMLITYLFRNRTVVRNVLYLVFALVLFFMVYTPYPTLSETLIMLAFNSDFMFILVIPFLACYDGTRGPNTRFAKYFFYVFYPLHLWIIQSIALLVH